MIKVGVFWVSALLTVDIIYDIEEYPNNCNSKDTLITYSKQHKDVWASLSKKQYDGKYSVYQYDTLPRGRVWYDVEEQSYKIIFYRGSKEFVDMISPKVMEVFGIAKAEISNDGVLNNERR